MRMLTTLFLLMTSSVFFMGCASREAAKSRPAAARKTPASAEATAKLVRSLQGKELECRTVDGIQTRLTKFREAGGKFFASSQTMTSDPSEMQIVSANRLPENPKALQFWFPYGTGTMSANTFAINCGN